MIVKSPETEAFVSDALQRGWPQFSWRDLLVSFSLCGARQNEHPLPDWASLDPSIINVKNMRIVMSF